MPKTPHSRTETYLAKIAGQMATPPDPWSRKEQYLDEIVEKMKGIETDIKKLYELIDAISYGQSDWAENDQNDPAYIKNRSHFDETIENELALYGSTDAGPTPDSNYVWFVEKVEGYSTSENLTNFSDGDIIKTTFIYSVNGVEKSDTTELTLAIEDGHYNLDSYAPAGSRWRGAYLSELDGDTTFRWPVAVSDVSATVYLTGIRYEKIKKLDAKYIPVDGETIIVNADGKLEIASNG